MTRLKEISKFINAANLVVDVGSDHAFLSIELIKSKKAKKVINLEKNLGPLKTGEKNIEAAKYQNKIFSILSDGLTELPIDTKIDYLVISGLGAKKIVEILSNQDVQWKYLVLQPNNHVEILRKWIKEKKLWIEDEKIVIENDIYYEIIKVSKKTGVKISTIEEEYFGPINLKNKSIEFINHWKQVLKYLKSLNQEKIGVKLKEKISMIERILK